MYGQNELFWGLGIEEETYLQFNKLIFVSTPLIREQHTEERYSVNYYFSYKPDYKKAVEFYLKAIKEEVHDAFSNLGLCQS